jgi:hypothetical protein
VLPAPSAAGALPVFDSRRASGARKTTRQAAARVGTLSRLRRAW